MNMWFRCKCIKFIVGSNLHGHHRDYHCSFFFNVLWNIELPSNSQRTTPLTIMLCNLLLWYCTKRIVAWQLFEQHFEVLQMFSAGWQKAIKRRVKTTA